MKLGMRSESYAHKGICKLYRHVTTKTRCHVLYLTARPIKLANETREYINGCSKMVALGSPGAPIHLTRRIHEDAADGAGKGQP